MVTVIIDDEAHAREGLNELIAMVAPHLEVVGEAGNVEEGLALIKSTQPALVLLDVDMPDGTGFDLLNEIGQPDFDVIFITAFSEFAIKAFRYAALDYLLKPIEMQELKEALERATGNKDRTFYHERLQETTQAFSTKELKRLVLSGQNETNIVEIDNIIRIESFRNYSDVHTVDQGKITVSKTLKELEELLPASRFFRTHQSHLVSLNFVLKYIKREGGYIVMKDESVVELARRRKDEFLNWLR